SAVVGPTTISPPWAEPANRAATLVVGPVAVNVQRCPAPVPSLVAPTSASPVLMPMWSWIAGKIPPYSSFSVDVRWWMAKAARVGHELGQLALELLEQRQSLARLLEVLERGLQLLVLGRQLGVGPGEPRRHVVERAPELADLVARLGWRPRLEIAVADAPGDRRECHDRPDDDGAHRHRQDGRGGQDRQRGDHDLAVPVAADLGEDRLHRGRDPHHRAHL